MNDELVAESHKTVIINRAVSGSGKTTLSRSVVEGLRARNLTVAAHSTDDFFMQNGRYVFELEKLNDYHARNLSDFIADLEKCTDVVICDNMNLLPWQAQPYTDAARKYGYRVLYLNYLPRELEKHLAAQVVTAEKPDAHGLSKELLQRFIENFNDYNDLLDRNTVRDIKRHHIFTWNDADHKAIDTGELAPYFDSDAVITIRPDEYQSMKTVLADMVLGFVCGSDAAFSRGDVKKHYLLTWYGITDIRAALGLEPTDGPVMGALRSGDFTDAIILGYTNLNKPGDGFSGELRAEWERLSKRPLDERLGYPRERIQTMVAAICNTEQAHSIFMAFLESAKLPVRIQFVPEVLSHLNDARAIDAAARHALRLALSDEDSKIVTCFLSPGTPVMAYTWGLLARENPRLHLHVIASSNPNKPPEEIDIPKELLAASAVPCYGAPPVSFDAIIHLLGNLTNLPQYFSIVQFDAPRHYFVTSEDSEKARALKKLLPLGATMETKLVDAFEPSHSRKAIESIIRSFPLNARIGVNLTGGTKLMFAGGLNACNEFSNAEPFYFDVKQHNVTFIRTGRSVPFKGVSSVDGFFVASGHDIITPGRWEDNPIREARKSLTLRLWAARQTLGHLYQSRDFRAYKTKYGYPDPPFSFAAPNIRASLGRKHAELELNGLAVQVPYSEDFGKYLGGGWLEEYAYLQLLPLVRAGKIFDLRIGLEISQSGHRPGFGETPYGEFDCTFTDGRRLYIVECKAGAVKQDHIQKLENNLKTYGGVAARGILFHAFPIHNMHQKRIAASSSVTAVCPAGMSPEKFEKAILWQ